MVKVDGVRFLAGFDGRNNGRLSEEDGRRMRDVDMDDRRRLGGDDQIICGRKYGRK